MENKFKLSTCSLLGDCSVTVLDNSKYLEENSTAVAEKQNYKQSEVAFIDVLYPYNGDKYEQVKISTLEEPTTFKISKDGCYTVKHIIVPTKNYLDRIKKQGVVPEDKYPNFYYMDNGTLYKLHNEVSVETDIEEIVLLDNNTEYTTSVFTEKNFVSICFLQKCYINLCKQILNNRGFSPCLDKSTVDKTLSYKRDIVWMAINVIKSLSDLEQLQEVQRIINLITNNCSGICTTDAVNKNSNDCGCSK